MDEQRLEAYLELIQSLLSCPNGQESVILQQNQNLIDKGFLLVIFRAVEVLRRQEQEKNASWLEHVAVQLAQTMESKNTRPLETSMSGDLQTILHALSQPSDVRDMARRVMLCKRALQLVSRRQNEALWAVLQHELGNSLSQNTKGDRVENIEAAIQAYQQSLQVMKPETMPVEWATSMMNLAVAYKNRIRGDRAENIEAAIQAYQQSLEVRTREDMPAQWATSMMNLAIAYSERIRGDRAENIETAIQAYQQSLEVVTREATPVDWARLMMNLANSYKNRIRGDRAENMETAIQAYQQSLEVRTREAMPVEWGLSLMNLANAYANRIRGNGTENIEVAIAAYRQSLEVRTREAMPIEWAETMNNLANAYYFRTCGDQAENIEAAIQAYQQSLEVRTREAMPIEWAETMNNLASAYSDRIRGDRAENIEAAVSAYQQFLQVVTREAMPVEWAISMNNLASAYSERIRGDRAENIEAAVSAYSQALTIFTPETHPNDCRRTASLLSKLYTDKKQWDKAQMTYETALNAVEILYQAALSKNSQEAELSETGDLYRRAAYTHAKVGNLTKAIATLEQGRARGLSETLQRDRTNLETIRQINPELIERYQTAANAINQLESTERRLTTDDSSPKYSQEDFRQQATQARQALKDCLTEIRQIPGYEKLLALPTFDDVVATVQPDHPVVYLVSTPNGSLDLILTTKGISDLWLNDLTEPQLIELLDNNWFSAYRESQTKRQGWLDAIDEGTHQLWSSMMAPLVSHLQKHHLSKAVLIPTGYLSYLPLHAAWTPDTTRPNGRRYAIDDIQFTYAPNALSLSAARTVAEQTSITTLLAINEPQPVNAGNLPSASAEVAKAIATFPDNSTWKLLQNKKATRTAVLEQLTSKNVVHFSCHGSADFATPLNSGLLMAHDEILSLRDLLDLKLQNLRLAILSACETGIPGIQLPDEVISLPTGLLQAGAAGVVSSLWSVADLSTMVLLSRFYDLWRNENLDPSEALRQAQIWLRDCNGPTLAPYLESTHLDIAREFEQALNQRPFAHPFYWAAFTYVGV